MPFNLSGPPQSPKQATTPGDWSSNASDAQMILLALVPYVRMGFALLLIALVLLLVACATPSTLPTDSARNPKPPQLREPLPSVNYLDSAQQLMENWRKKLIGM